MKIEKKLRKFVLERDNHRCLKCGNEDGLEVHHIKERSDGGLDEENNLITLCYACHAEWHLLKLHLYVTFDEWVKVPPLRVVIQILVNSKLNEFSLGDLKHYFKIIAQKEMNK